MYMQIKYLYKYLYVFNNRNVCDYDKMFLMYVIMLFKNKIEVEFVVFILKNI